MIPPPLLGVFGWMGMPTVYCVGFVAYVSAAGAGSCTAIVRTQVALPPEFVAVIVYCAAAVTAVGVPVMNPEAGSRLRPAGSGGETVYETTAPPPFEGTSGVIATPRP